jgi:hypothetical protein
MIIGFVLKRKIVLFSQPLHEDNDLLPWFEYLLAFMIFNLLPNMVVQFSNLLKYDLSAISFLQNTWTCWISLLYNQLLLSWPSSTGLHWLQGTA